METNKIAHDSPDAFVRLSTELFSKRTTEVESTYVLELHYRFRYRKIVCRKKTKKSKLIFIDDSFQIYHQKTKIHFKMMMNYDNSFWMT